MSGYDPNHVPKKEYFLVGQKCVVFSSEGKILLLKRSEKAGSGGKWNLIGGGLDHNEDPIEGIKREAREEAELDLVDIKPISVVSFTEDQDQILMICYSAKTKGEPKLNWEHDEYKWVTKDEALQENLSETIKNFIKQSD